MEDSARPLAVVTGASSGIGLELAKEFAGDGFDLLIAAEDDELQQAAATLRGTGADVQAVQVDLATFDGVEQLYAAITATGRPVEALALNAGVGLGGGFVDSDLQAEIRLIQLNIVSTVHLAKLVLKDMVTRDSGKVLFTSSIASEMPGSFQSVYNASKSFVQSFSQAVREELKDTGITITALMPGPTDTQFFERAGMLDTKVGSSKKDSAAKVAKQGYAALMAGKDKIVAGGVGTKLQGLGGKITPDSVKAKLHRSMAEPGSGE